MQLFKISDGPWKKLFSGKFQEHDIDIYSNPESVLLILIFEKEGDKVKGAVVELYKIFYSEGEAEPFVETLPREVILLTKHDEKETIKFLLLGSTPSYVEWKESTFISETDRLLKRLSTSTTMIKDVSKAYELTLTELGDAPDRIKEIFFTQPLLVPLVSTAAHPEEGDTEIITRKEIILGLTREKNQVVEPLNFFTRTMVSGGEENERNHVLHIFAESALLSSLAVIIFDWDGKFTGLGEASKEHDELKKYKVDIEPIGFPVKPFSITRDIVVDLNLTNIVGVAQLFGVGDDTVNKTIETTLQKNKVTGIKDLISKVRAITPGEEPTAYEINKAARILTLMDIRYPALFEGKNDIKEISKKWGKIGRASIIKLEDVDKRVALITAHNLLKAILEFHKSKERTRNLKTLFILPEVNRLFAEHGENLLTKEIIESMVEIQDVGVGFILSSRKRMDLPKALLEKIEANVNIVSGNDIGVHLKDKKSYRVFARPGLSKCTEQ